ncbi:MAG: hypothetical protein WHV44_03810 [Anaerolineales bacterium]
MDYLIAEGYRPTIDSDGDVVFKHEGRTYYIEIDTNDEQFFRIVFPNFWSVESEEELARVILAANYATMKTKVAKVYLRSDSKDTVASVEMFFGRPEHFKEGFRRAMSALQAGVNNFIEKVHQAPN